MYSAIASYSMYILFLFLLFKYLPFVDLLFNTYCCMYDESSCIAVLNSSYVIDDKDENLGPKSLMYLRTYFCAYAKKWPSFVITKPFKMPK